MCVSVTVCAHRHDIVQEFLCVVCVTEHIHSVSVCVCVCVQTVHVVVHFVF